MDSTSNLDLSRGLVGGVGFILSHPPSCTSSASSLNTSLHQHHHHQEPAPAACPGYQPAPLRPCSGCWCCNRSTQLCAAGAKIESLSLTPKRPSPWLPFLCRMDGDNLLYIRAGDENAKAAKMSASTSTRSSKRERHPDNVEGSLYVDRSCIDCATCRWLAPGVYGEKAGQSVVTRQPTTEEGRREAYRAMVACPVGSIKTTKGDPLVKQAREDFPLLVSPGLAGVYYLGFTAATTYGCSSYFIQGAGGNNNVMVDVPRFSNLLASRLEELGGVHTMVLSHRDDVGEHAKWKERFPGLRRVLHEYEVDSRTVAVEVKLKGEGPWSLPGFADEEAEVLFTPGHTEGHICLLLKRGEGALFTGDHLARQEGVEERLSGHPDYNWYDKKLQAASIVKLADLPYFYKHLLPGHGGRYVFEGDRSDMEALGQRRRDMFVDAAERLQA